MYLFFLSSLIIYKLAYLLRCFAISCVVCILLVLLLFTKIIDCLHFHLLGRVSLHSRKLAFWKFYLFI